ncbi:MAG: hypothetical protein HGA78_01145 [Nitrospirales bacterium]|nr:hypothetical protein [Nitrospirales bacterium]
MVIGMFTGGGEKKADNVQLCKADQARKKRCREEFGPHLDWACRNCKDMGIRGRDNAVSK